MTKKTWVTLGSSHRVSRLWPCGQSFVMRNTVVMLKGGSKRVVRLQLDAANPNTDVLRSYKRRFLSSLLGAAACLTSCAARDGGGGDKHKGECAGGCFPPTSSFKDPLFVSMDREYFLPCSTGMKKMEPPR
jgi:hypothetical protein